MYGVCSAASTMKSILMDTLREYVECMKMVAFRKKAARQWILHRNKPRVNEGSEGTSVYKKEIYFYLKLNYSFHG